MQTIPLLGLTRRQLADWLASVDASPAKAGLILKALHQQGRTQFDDHPDLAKSLRARMAEQLSVLLPQVIDDQLSNDGTRKWLLQFQDGNSVETVYIPEGERGTLCVSSQVGCGLNCSFCATGKQGFNRNLSAADIMAQVWIAARHYRLSNIVFMGMGEPLLNLDNVLAAVEILLDDYGYGLSKHRVTISTSGLVPAMKTLSSRSDVSLAVSLHAPTDPLRDVLVPINKKYPIAELLTACREYYGPDSSRTILFEYVMLKDVNDKDEHAHALVDLLQKMPAKVNLIPFNPFPGSGYERSLPERIEAFHGILMRAGLLTVTRKTRGKDIDAACGQLVGEFKDRTQRRRLAVSASSQINSTPI